MSTIAGGPIALAENPSDTQIGWFGGTAILVLSDGEETGGPDPADIASLASIAGIRVSTVGVGTTGGTTIKVDGFAVATALDEDTLRTLAESSGGSYIAASDSESIAGVGDSVQLSWTARMVPHEITSLVVAAAALLVLLGTAWSIVRTGGWSDEARVSRTSSHWRWPAWSCSARTCGGCGAVDGPRRRSPR